MTKLTRDLRKSMVSLTDAIYSGLIPEHVLHHFACDCAERSLLHMYAAHQSWRRRLLGLFYRNKEFKILLWDALRAKRQWIEGRLLDERLEEMSLRLKESIHRVGRRVKGDAVMAVNCALMQEAKDAAWCASRYAAGVSFWLPSGRGEKEWQRKHLASLLEQCDGQRGRLLWMLLHHEKFLKETLQQERVLMESVLF